MKAKICSVTFTPPGKSSKPYMRFTIAYHTGSMDWVAFGEATKAKGLGEIRTGRVKH